MYIQVSNSAEFVYGSKDQRAFFLDPFGDNSLTILYYVLRVVDEGGWLNISIRYDWFELRFDKNYFSKW